MKAKFRQKCSIHKLPKKCSKNIPKKTCLVQPIRSQYTHSLPPEGAEKGYIGNEWVKHCFF